VYYLLLENNIIKNFDEQKFWDKLHSYNLEKYLTLENEKFNGKLDETLIEIKKNWL
jgi:hypothetical protein